MYEDAAIWKRTIKKNFKPSKTNYIIFNKKYH